MLITGFSKKLMAHRKDPKYNYGLRLERLTYDQYRCRTCWSPTSLEVHHVSYEFLNRDEACTLDYLITLCRLCHHAITNRMRAERLPTRRLKVQATTRLTPVVIRETAISLLTLQPSARVTPAIARDDRGLQDLIVSPQKRITPIDAPRRSS